MEAIVQMLLVILLIVFFVYETYNWFALQAFRVKLNFKKEPVTQEEAEKILSRVRRIYFWLSSPYYYDRMRECYYLAFDSPYVELETKEQLRKSTGRRMVRGLRKAQQGSGKGVV